jgi:transcriptional regulator with XRE-family HTH domain
VETIQTRRHAALVALLIAQRQRAGLRQEDVAARLRQHQSFVARIESGQRRIDVVEFIALAEAIGFDPAKALRSIAKVRSG